MELNSSLIWFIDTTVHPTTNDILKHFPNLKISDLEQFQIHGLLACELTDSGRYWSVTKKGREAREYSYGT